MLLFVAFALLTGSARDPYLLPLWAPCLQHTCSNPTEGFALPIRWAPVLKGSPCWLPLLCPRLSHFLQLFSWGDMSRSLLLGITACRLLAALAAVAAALALFSALPCMLEVHERVLALKSKVSQPSRAPPHCALMGLAQPRLWLSAVPAGP